MRLTLRTLLAYIDHVLDPSDTRELAAKIRESKLAQHTMERIDLGLANRNLRAPSVDSTDQYQDPNIIAEYLDNTMKPEDVPQFERQCFENDAQLIETASVHRILSVALTRPAEVSDELNQRLKGLLASPESDAMSNSGASGAAASIAPTANTNTSHHLRVDPGTQAKATEGGEQRLHR